MNLTFKEVDQILRIIEEFPAAEVRFEYGDLKLHVRRETAREAGSAAPAGMASPAAALAPAAAPAAAAPAQPKPAAAAPAKTKRLSAPEQREGLVPVTAPMMGVYYAAPSPDAAPFASVGQKVSESSDLCIIEVMKVMNTIKAPCAGTVVEIVAANAAMVEQGSAMLWIRPDAARS
ncbi:acetyl-CoA carboxylase biotin carboxyl carrier protein [Variovorax sp. PBL-E5]|uniref:acetyl-CoA carboxylase biotin carboxyl carrier protein n=1 Tax=Variovorax sp. PBL-E5 TaxID=434014 RepID=UPI00131944CA|nr:biotin/lipoyl-containing protein [Variovorax sp. PBL-E5]VTU30310.1 Biotin carboxyl carrier protein of acetyl-CoA carboxylase [Variovorax sp. PBL-E5]